VAVTDPVTDLDSVAAAASIMEEQRAATRRATLVHSWIQMILWGGLYCVVGLTILIVGGQHVSPWPAGAFVALAAVAVAIVAATTWGLDNPAARAGRIGSIVFVVIMMGLAGATTLVPRTGLPGALAPVWVGTIASCALVAGWVGFAAIVMRNPLEGLIAGALAVIAVTLLLLVLLRTTDRAAALFTVATGAASVALAFPVRRLEQQFWGGVRAGV